MKKYLASFLFLAPVLLSLSSNNQIKKIEEPISIAPKPVEIVITPECMLIEALIEVESLGNDSAIGDRHLVGEEAVGALQIRPIMMREVNRILKLKGSKVRYKRKDRFSRDKSIEMFLIWKEFHHKDSDFEKIARNWNGGPNGYKKSRTEQYWAKVEAQLNN